MWRRALLPLLPAAAGLLAAVGSAPAAPASPRPEPAPVAAAWLPRVEAWLDGARRLRARFTQIAPDGSVSTGTLWLARPGRMRIEYDPPSRVLIVATDWRLVIYDGATRQVNTLPLAETPLAFLLEERVRLAGRVQVAAVRERGGEVAVTLEDAETPGRGAITLWFRREPFRLVRWEVVDAQGLTTVVLLDAVERDPPMSDSLFVWRDPRIFGYPGEEDRLPE